MDTIGITIDCSADEVDDLVAFWAAALGYEQVLPRYLVDPAGVRPRLSFEVVPEPKVAKNRWHFDLKVGGGRDVPLDVRTQRVIATVERLVTAGATVLRIKDEPEMGFYAAAMQDPEGNEFDVV